MTRVVVLAGSEPLAYSGLEADVRHLTALDCDAISIPTARTRQALDRVLAIESSHVGWIEQVLVAGLQDADAVKIGMLHRGAVSDVVASALEGCSVPVVCDPVLAATGGHALLDAAGKDSLLSRLMPRISVLTPNLPELAALTGAERPGEMVVVAAARSLIDRGARAVLVKGGHAIHGAEVTDVLVTEDSVERFASPRIAGPVPRGTGCALSSSIAAELAAGVGVTVAVASSRARISEAIARAVALGTRFLTLR